MIVQSIRVSYRKYSIKDKKMEYFDEIFLSNTWENHHAWRFSCFYRAAAAIWASLLLISYIYYSESTISS